MGLFVLVLCLPLIFSSPTCPASIIQNNSEQKKKAALALKILKSKTKQGTPPRRDMPHCLYLHCTPSIYKGLIDGRHCGEEKVPRLLLYSEQTDAHPH